MTGSEYQDLAMRTNDGKGTARLIIRAVENNEHIDFGGIMNACLGLSGEVGEFNDMVKKWVFHEKALDVAHAKKELGDCMWYIAMVCQSFGWDMNEIMQVNVDKLLKRYPDGFDVQKANNRSVNDV